MIFLCVFSTYGDKKLYEKLEKCEFFVLRVTFLRYVVSCNGMKVNEAKVDAVRSWPVPTSVTAARSFHDLASFYIGFINDFSIIMARLIELSLIHI